ncbi:helix-turn-helix domain-containing protein [Halalkalibacter kiskunsagensis]|uniref:Helix-turn-helix domain-containing protein n=1 Tax=Halalkalibacter kiskunsagensis TaxID=1548599 RepID=A0ABV6KAN0_9BACI
MVSNENHEKMTKLLEITKLLTKSLKIETVLDTLVKAANDLIEISDTVILYLYHPEENTLKVAEGVGINRNMMDNIAFAPGESITGKAFLNKKSYLFAEEGDVKKNMESMSERNFHFYFQGVYERQVKSAFCVPLLYQEKCLGVLLVDNFENEGRFTEDDMSIIEMIADQSAIAIVNSDLFRTIKEKNQQLEHSFEIHQKFTNVSLEGGGIGTIISLLSRILGMITKFTEQKGADVRNNIFPIIRGKETLGYIQVEKDLNMLNTLEQVALEHAATALSLEIVKQNAFYEKELHFREEVFQQIVDGVPSGDLKQITKHFNWNTEWDFVCIVMEGKENPLWKEQAIRDKERFIRSTEEISRSVSQFSFVFTRGFRVILVVPVTEKEDVVGKITTFIEGKWAIYKGIVYGVGRTGSLFQLGNSYREAVDAVRYGKVAGTEKVITYSKLGVERLIQKVDQTTLDYYVQDKLGDLFSMESVYFTTLTCFIEANKNHKRTVEQLHIHPNTLYHRLKKIERTLQISLERDDDWINLVVAYRIYVGRHKN